MGSSPVTRLRIWLMILLAWVGIGIIGYQQLGWSFLDALYMTGLVLSTVGLTEVRPLDPEGKAFTVVLMVGGLGSMAFVARQITEVLLGDHLEIARRRKRMERELATISDHYIICGWGRMGREVSHDLERRHVKFVVIEPDPAMAEPLEECGYLHVEGDAANDDVLRKAGVERAKGLVALAPTDAQNTFITLSARALNPNLTIVARSILAADVQKLSLAGADRVVSPYIIGARTVAASLMRPHVADFLDLEVSHGGLGWELAEVRVAPDSDLSGQTLREGGIRERCGCTVLAVRSRETGQFESNPSADFVINAGDELIVVGTPSQMERLERIVGLPESQRSQPGI